MEISRIYEEIDNMQHLDKEELYCQLITLFSKTKVGFVMYDLFQYVHKETERKEIRKNQDTFRKELVERYKRCVITECSAIVCEACHIVPFCDCNEIDKYNVDNGLLMRADLHKLFDSGHLIINPYTMKINFSDNVLNDRTMSQYIAYDGKKINVNEKSVYFLMKNI